MEAILADEIRRVRWEGEKEEAEEEEGGEGLFLYEKEMAGNN